LCRHQVPLGSAPILINLVEDRINLAGVPARPLPHGSRPERLHSLCPDPRLASWKRDQTTNSATRLLLWWYISV